MVKQKSKTLVNLSKSAKMKGKKSKKKITALKKRRFYEIFKIKKKGKEKIVKIESFETIEEKPAKEQIKKENKILRNLFISIGVIAVLFLSGSLIINNMNNFEYKGVKFQKVDEVAPYKTSFPVLNNGNIVPYNIYIRNDPRELDKIEFNGEMNLIDNMVISSTNDFNCDGDGIIAVANLVNFYSILGVNIFKNETLFCDEEDKYTFIQIQESNQTSIEQFGWSCYNININNCEILEGTERFMIESFIEVNKLIRES